MVQFPMDKMEEVRVVEMHRTQSWKRACWNKFVEFCNRTDLHGFKYIVMEDFNKKERWCWVVALLASTMVAAYFVGTAYVWFSRNPIVTVIESTQGVIWDVPFPAVTVCDLNTVSRKAARELANNLTLSVNITADYIFDSFRLISLMLSTFKGSNEELVQLRELQDILDLNNITIHSLFKKLSPASPCNQLVQKCMWKNTMYRCDELFKPIYTLLSVCCTFNYYAIRGREAKDLTFQLSRPRRVASCGYQTALTVLLYTNTDDYYSASVASQGVLVIIDNAYNVPDLDSPVRMVIPSTEVLIALSPERTYATPGLKAFTPTVRQCYYSDEIELGQFRKYSFHNCMAFQKVVIIKKICGCVPIFYPSEAEYRDCNFRDIDCIQSLHVDYMKHNGSDSMSNQFECLPECEHYDYPLEVALSKLVETDFLNTLPYDNITLQNRSLLNVFFNDLVSTRYRRDVYFNWQNILAAFGGLLSLMLGFTLISGFDLVIFFTIRILGSSCTSVVNDKKAPNKVDIKTFSTNNKWMPEVTHQNNIQINRDDYEYAKY